MTKKHNLIFILTLFCALPNHKHNSVMEDETMLPEAAPEMAAEPKPKHSLYDKIKAMHPEREFADDDEILSAAEERMSDHENYRSQNEEANKVISEALKAEPVLAMAIEDVYKGASLVVALAKYISPQDLEEAAKEAEPESYAEALKMREENRKAHTQFMDEVNANTAESQKVIEAWSAKRGLEPEAVTAFVDEVSSALSDLFKGKITEPFLDSMWEAKTKPEDLATVASEAEIKGRNAKIEELTAKDTEMKGDGLPALTSMGTQTKPPAPAKQKSELEEIADYSKRTRG